MKIITSDSANKHLSSIGFRISSWNGIESTKTSDSVPELWEKIRAPNRNLLNFCHHVVNWLPKGGWKLFQIDNSTGWMDPIQLSLFAGLLLGENNQLSYNQNTDRSIFFEFGEGEVKNAYTDLLIANLTFVFLLFNSHAYIVSSGSIGGELIAVQDGYVYLISDTNLVGVRELKSKKNDKFLTPPEWILEFISDSQT